MASNFMDRLSREDWDPMPGDILTGILLDVFTRDSKDGRPYPVLVIRADDSSAEWLVNGAPMLSDILHRQPQIGERVGAKFWGRLPKRTGDGEWDKYTFDVDRPENAPKPVDWSGMAASRGITLKAAPQARQAGQAAPGDDPWASEAPADTPVPF